MKKYEHGGNIYEAAEQAGCNVDDIIDLSSNVSPFQPDGIFDGLDVSRIVSRLPEPYSQSLVKALAVYHEIPEDNIITGCGSTEFIDRVCSLYKGRKAVVVQPAYVDYMKYARQNGIQVTSITLQEKKGFSFDYTELLQPLASASLCFLCNPNNPTGTIISVEDIKFLAEMFKKTQFIIDESYIEFCLDYTKSFIGCCLDNVAILRSFSKVYGMPGIRAGSIISGNRALREELRDMVSPWSLNSLAQELCLRAVKEVISPNVKKISDIRRHTVEQLSSVKELKLFRSRSNFILIKLRESDSSAFCDYMLKHRILVRDCSNFIGLDNRFIRISVKAQEHMEKFCLLAEKFFMEAEGES